MNRSEFVAIIAPIAQKLWQDGSGALFPSIRLAQTILETGGTIHPWNNIVGYKVGSGAYTAYWKGASVSTKTWEVYNGVRQDNVQANWRSYASVEDCLRDQDLLFQLPRYKDVREAKTPEDQAVALYRCGYATDGDYHKKLIAIAAPYKGYDTAKNPVLKEEPKLDEWVANTIYFTWIKPTWEKANAANDQQTMDNMHLLANKLRAACGMREDEDFE